uniref:Reverse transcriptase domain-containing protein n=1 Tax=Aegilops tauschii subsp. strangulata TaxID=200361 RepID=A0A453BXQ6_AEGTS
MAQAAFLHFDALLGTAADREHSLDLSRLIEPTDLADLNESFSMEEIWEAVKRLPAHKAPGPDGFTTEFLRACWSIIKQDFLDVFQQLYNLRGRGFSKLNQALLTLLPKHAAAHGLRNYRPISLIHIVAKLFAKVLSIRLSAKLDRLVSRNQNAFIPGRSLHDNFVLVKQSLKMYRLGAPRVMLKLDLTCAFDSISWPFLFEVLRQYGFRNRFMEWTAILLSSSSTRILMNGELGPPIWHRQGLRQGDSMSPQLFVLAVDTLGRLLGRAHSLAILQPLHPCRNIPVISLYADDVMIFCHATADDVAAVREVLALFGRASELQVNFAKSSATVLHGDQTATETIAHLSCPVVTLPITYLGIPLSTSRPSAAQLQPMVDAVVARLPSWKAWLMTKIGRLALVKSVLCAIPVHQLLAFAPPKKTIKQLEKIQRGFHWAGRAATNGGHCHVNWSRVCRPIELGGLGVRDLERAGLALRLRWLWFAKTSPERAWQGLGLPFSPTERVLFWASTTMAIGNGQTALLWEDRWINGQSVRELLPNLYDCIPKRRRMARTVADGLIGNSWARDIHGNLGLHDIGQYLQLWQVMQRTVLSAAPDQLIWK